MVVDDDIYLHQQDIQNLFELWQLDPQRIIGIYGRLLKKQNDEWIYRFPENNQYNIILTKMMILDSQYLGMFRCLLPKQITNYITINKNCEDITMNLLVYGYTGKKPMRYKTLHSIIDTGIPNQKDYNSALSNNPYYFPKSRSSCVNFLSNYFNISKVHAHDVIISKPKRFKKNNDQNIIKKKKIPWKIFS